jgi:hypothetical protein
MLLRSLLTAALAHAGAPALAQACMAQSGASATPVVELYTSEGCNSCPPADRWLSALKADPAPVALAFHVDYWDSLGWVDRFASPAYTQRQARQQAVNGSRYSYTPQVVVNGVDRKDWASLKGLPAARAPAGVQIKLMRGADTFTATIQSNTGTRLAAYWAVTESGHSSVVKAGENAGATLRHDHVVRELQPVAAWAAEAGMPTTLQFRPTVPTEPVRARGQPGGAQRRHRAAGAGAQARLLISRPSAARRAASHPVQAWPRRGRSGCGR